MSLAQREAVVTDKQAKAQRGKKRGVYKIRVPRDYGGRGAIKCAVCGLPIVKHKTMDFCLGRKKR